MPSFFSSVCGDRGICRMMQFTEMARHQYLAQLDIFLDIGGHCEASDTGLPDDKQGKATMFEQWKQVHNPNTNEQGRQKKNGHHHCQGGLN